MKTRTNTNGNLAEEVTRLAPMDFDEFDDELQTMQELIESEDITLSDQSFDAPLKSLRLRKAIVVQAGTMLQTCIDTMLARKIGCLLVVKEGALCGIFTERDVLLKIAGESIDLQMARVDDYMTPDIIALTANDTLKAVMNLMHKGRYRHVPIVDGMKKPVAVVSIKNIIHYMVEFFPQDVLNLPPHPIRTGTKNREGG